MSMNKATLLEVNRVAAEVLELSGKVWMQIEAEHVGAAPYDATPVTTGTVTTAALRRRSMDLTRLLAEMRRAQ